MMKKRFLGLIFSAFIAFGTLMFSLTANKDIKASKADYEHLVDTPEIGWNNVDYSINTPNHWAPDTNENGVPQNGYCLLPLYPEDISTVERIEDNLLNLDIEGCNVKDHILINGVESQYVDDVIIYAYPKNGFFIYVPYSSISFSDEYDYLTIDVLEGMSIDGSAYTVATTFEYRGLLRSFGKWEINPEPIEKKNGSFSKIDWNNVDFSYTIKDEKTGKPAEWTGDLLANGAPENGYCLLAFFHEEGKEYADSVIGDVTITENGVIGLGLNVDYKVKVNGVNLIDVLDAKCYLFPKYGLFFYIPHTSIVFSDEYPIPTIEIEEGLHFNNVYLSEITFEFRGELGDVNCWTYIKEKSEYNHYPFEGVAELWNNIALDASHNQTILQFGEYGKDYLKNDKISNPMNMVNKYSDCGIKISVNGVPLSIIDDATVSYYHGFCYVYMVLPISCLIPNNEYKIVTLHIEENTIFYDTMLPEVNLYLLNDKWVETKPETPSDSDYENSLSLYDAFGEDKAILDEDNNQLFGTAEYELESCGLLLDYSLKNEDSVYVLYIAGKDNQSGFKLVFKNNIITVHDATSGSVLLDEIILDHFNYDEWYSLLFYTKVIEEKLTICVAIDGITKMHLDNVMLSDNNKIGNCFSLNWANGLISFKNAKAGEDNKKPELLYEGKATYTLLVGSEAIDFSNKCSAFDSHDGDVTHLIEFNYPEGSLTDNKINKGVWKIQILARDKSDNVSELFVTVIGVEKLEVVVTFDNSNPTTYRAGDHIASIPNPIKEGYRFIGWYYNDILWDFENDYVIEDMNLISKYQLTTEEFILSIKVEGLPGVNNYSLYFKYGSEIDISLFNKDGYTLKAYLNDNEVTSLVMTSDLDLKLVYSEDNSHKEEKGGCGGSIVSSVALISIASGIAFTLLYINKKKGGKEHE